MAMKNRVVAFVAGVLLGPALVWAGLETGTYISDLVATNPLSSDLASTADDHIRLLKSTIKTTFPNINGAVTVTDEVLNGVPTGSANPTGTIGLSAVNGAATTYMRSDGAPALSQAIAPTMSGIWTFSKTGYGTGPAAAVNLSASQPVLAWNETGAAANNRLWAMLATSEQWIFQTPNDAVNAASNIMTVDRTGTTVDRVTFPTGTFNSFVVGPVGSITATVGQFRGSGVGALAAATTGGSSVVPIYAHNEATSGDNVLIEFRTDGGAGSIRGNIDYDRAGGLVRYNTTSDIRLKKNFKRAPSARGLIDCIKIESYDWNETGNHVDHGLVAQRLNKCAPYAVSKGDVWQVDKSTLIPAMIKYMQEQDARISALERRLN